MDNFWERQGVSAVHDEKKNEVLTILVFQYVI
jgi:hypothetical protein